MPNRAERRAQAKQNRRGVPQQYDQTRGRGRSGMLDEYQLQEKSRRLQDGIDGPWKPTGGSVVENESLLTTSPNYTNPKMFKAPHSARQWFRVISWLLIALSAIAFLVIMWLPSHPHVPPEPWKAPLRARLRRRIPWADIHGKGCQPSYLCSPLRVRQLFHHYCKANFQGNA